MKKRVCVATIAIASMFAGNVAADDSLSVEGTPHEKHAQRIFSGVFGQCRTANVEASGIVALVFSVRPNGRFSATSTFKSEAGRDALRALSLCMGERANQARPFPAGSSAATVGVKYEVKDDGSVLIMQQGDAATLSPSQIFKWARSMPGSGNS